MALTDADANRRVPVITQKGALYSGFHQGAGEITIAELLQADIPEYALVLIDEVESSLHPQAQRRLIRDLADCCRERQLQIILTTHSPYVMEELPPEARAYIMQQGDRREIVYGVSPEFAISKMDDVPQYECELYVEDERAGRMLTEILAARDPELVHRCQLTPYGAASVGKSLGQMVASDKFRRPTCVFLDGDRGEAPGCITLPGDDAPERVVFGAIAKKGWQGIVSRLGRSYPDVVDSCERAMALTDHHQWVQQAAARLTVGGENLWQALCAEWATSCLDDAEAMDIARRIRDRLEMIPART
jgi:energy-coupling factor transporter ATP-binding protein EcfA2